VLIYKKKIALLASKQEENKGRRQEKNSQRCGLISHTPVNSQEQGTVTKLIVLKSCSVRKIIMTFKPPVIKSKQSPKFTDFFSCLSFSYSRN
jgi:hypothetical protein